MLRQKLLFILGVLLAVGAFGQNLAAQNSTPNPPALDDLGHFVGTWKATINENGEQRIQYLIFVNRPELNALAQWTFNVHPESKQLDQVIFGFVGIPRRTNQIQGLVFSSNGLVAETMGTLEGKELYMKGYGTMANGVRVSADVAYKLDGDGRLIQNWTDMMSPMGHLAEGMTREFTKVDANINGLFRDGEIVAPDTVELDAALKPLSHLAGHWQSIDADGNVQHDLHWQGRGLGRWLVERWILGNGRRGKNITGLDPATGQMTLWAVSRDNIGRVGRWDVVDDNTVGQVQGLSRINREFVKTDTEEMLVTRWERNVDGRFVSTDNSYVVKRISQDRQDETPRDTSATTQSSVDYGEPMLFCRIEYMQVPAEGEDLYFDVEKAWKKIHRARRDAGLINNWMLMKVSRPPEVQGDYNYVVVHLSSSLEKLRDGNTADLQLEFSPEELEILAQTDTARECVRTDYWDLVSTADKDRIGQPGFDPTMLIGRMQSKNEARHWELEKTVWSKLWKQQVADGHLWNWHLWRRRTGDGFNFVTVHVRPEGQTTAPPSVGSDEVLKKALPDMSREEFGRVLQETNQVRDMVGSEQWTLIDWLDRDE